jgi:hypothetical protein
MKKGKIILFGILAAAILGVTGMSLYITSPETCLAQFSTQGLPENPDLQYTLWAFGVIPVGQARISPVRLEQWHMQQLLSINANAETHPALAKFFKASGTVITYADPRTYAPALSIIETRIKGKPTQSKEIEYDQAGKTMRIDNTVRAMQGETLDPLSVLLKLRHMDFSSRKEFEFILNTNQKNYSLKGSVKEKRIRMHGKPVTLYLVKMLVARKDKNPYHKSSVDFVFLGGKENIPLLFTVRAAGAFATARLTRALQ